MHRTLDKYFETLELKCVVHPGPVTGKIDYEKQTITVEEKKVPEPKDTPVKRKMN